MRFLSSPWQCGAQVNLRHILLSAQVFSVCKERMGPDIGRLSTRLSLPCTQKHKEEKVGRPVLKMGSSEDYFIFLRACSSPTRGLAS